MTAKFNEGLCGTCKRHNEEAEYQRKKVEQREAEKRQGLHYDIDSLLVGPDFLSDIDGALPEPDDARYGLLTEDEKALQALAEFDRRSANGFRWLLDNEYYELVDRAHQAARRLGPTRLLTAFDKLEALMYQYGLPNDPSQRVKSYWDLDVTVREAYNADLVRLDSQYFHSRPDEPSIYTDPPYGEAIKRWVAENVEKFRLRKGE